MEEIGLKQELPFQNSKIQKNSKSSINPKNKTNAQQKSKNPLKNPKNPKVSKIVQKSKNPSFANVGDLSSTSLRALQSSPF